LWIKEEDVLIEGDTVVTRHVGRGTHEGTFMDLEATGNEFEIDGIDVYRIEDGKIAESWINLDMMGMMQQLGVIPTEEESA
jgi:predicted ester cyclase